MTVFSVAGNKVRLVARVEYGLGMVYIRKVLTHHEYDKNNRKEDPWF